MKTYTYWETLIAHESAWANENCYLDRGRRFPIENLDKVREYGRKRLMGYPSMFGESEDCRGWYIEDENGNVIEKHTYTIGC